MQKQPADRGVKKVSEWMAMKINDKYFSPGDAGHLLKNFHDRVIFKVMREKRADCEVKLSVGKGESQRVATHSRYFAGRLFKDCLG